LAEDKQTLIFPDISGAGKTVMAATGTKVLSSLFHDDLSIGLAYTHCDSWQENRMAPVF
jgi:hypothetical protein